MSDSELKVQLSAEANQGMSTRESDRFDKTFLSAHALVDLSAQLNLELSRLGLCDLHTRRREVSRLPLLDMRNALGASSVEGCVHSRAKHGRAEWQLHIAWLQQHLYATCRAYNAEPYTPSVMCDASAIATRSLRLSGYLQTTTMVMKYIPSGRL